MTSLEQSPERHELLETDLLECYKRNFGVNFVTGLPCGELREFIQQSQSDQEIMHMPVTNERESIGLATGAWLGGKNPAVYMQNSGLFVASNDIGSLMIPSQVEAVFAISWRGGLGETATQHLITGKNTPLLLDGFGFESTSQPTEESIRSLHQRQEKSHMPAAVLIRRQKYNVPPTVQIHSIVERPHTTIHDARTYANSLSREAALDIIMNDTQNKYPTVSSTGLISRSLFDHYDADNHFYNAGGFGLTSAIALGVAVTKPNTPVIAVEGDGSVLTNPGSINLIGHYQPRALLHVVLDNKSLASCSYEQTIGSDLIPQLAQISGYHSVYCVDDTRGLSEAIHTALEVTNEGPQMIYVDITAEGARSFRRPTGMDATATRFRRYLEDLT